MRIFKVTSNFSDEGVGQKKIINGPILHNIGFNSNFNIIILKMRILEVTSNFWMKVCDEIG